MPRRSPSTLAYFFHSQELAVEVEERIRTRVLDPARIELIGGAYERTENIGTSTVDGMRYPSADLLPCSICGNVHHRNGSDGSVIYPNNRNFCGTECSVEGGIVSVGGQTIDLHDCRHSLLSYSATADRVDTATVRDPYRFGVEVEKEDYEAKENALREALEHGWIAVSDGSLGCDGFELVSPCYNYDTAGTEWREVFASWDILSAPSSSSCGGHITVSKKGLTGPQLVRHMGDTVPLLFAMFPWRLRSQWASPRNASQMADNGDKYRAVNVKSECVEYRIFNRVQSGKQLAARVDLLCRCMKRSECDGFDDELADRDSPLWKLVNACYGEGEHAEKRDAAIERFNMFKPWYYGRYASTDLHDEDGALHDILRFVRR